MLTDLEARVALKELIEKYLREIDADFDRLIGIIHDPSRQVPIRGVLEAIRRYNNAQYSQQELDLIDELLYMYG